MRIQDLRPGQRLAGPLAGGATLISWSTPHPVYPELALVVWRMDDGRLSMDALHPEQHDVSGGQLVAQSEDERLEALRRALDPPAPAPADVPESEVRHYIGAWGELGGRLHVTLSGSFVNADGSYLDPRDPIPVGRFRTPKDGDGPFMYPVSAEIAADWLPDDGLDDLGDEQ